MVSVVATLHFQSVSQKWHDGLTSDLACACNWSSRYALFYYATIAYHVGLNAVLGLPHPGPTS